MIISTMKAFEYSQFVCKILESQSGGNESRKTGKFNFIGQCSQVK